MQCFLACLVYFILLQHAHSVSTAQQDTVIIEQGRPLAKANDIRPHRPVRHKNPNMDSAANKQGSSQKTHAAIYVEAFAESVIADLHMAQLVASVQRLGYTADILCSAEKPPVSAIQVVDVARDLGIVIAPDTVQTVAVKKVGIRLYTRRTYGLFVSIGKMSVPPYLGLGQLNLHVMVPPEASHTSTTHFFTLSSYDAVLVPSEAALRRTLEKLETLLIATVRAGALIPQFHSLALDTDAIPQMTSLHGHFSYIPTSQNKMTQLTNHTYIEDFTKLFYHLQSALPLRHVLQRAGRALQPPPITLFSTKMAVCVELRHHYAMRASLINVMTHLQTWSVTLFHGKRNGNFVDEVLIDMPNVNLQQLPFETLTAAQYSALIASTSFWSSIQANTVFLFCSGTLLKAPFLESVLNAQGVIADSHHPIETLDLGRPAFDAGVHAAAFINVQKARRNKAKPSNMTATRTAACSLSADGPCYSQLQSTSVAITATANFQNKDRLQSMVHAALGVRDTRQDPLAWTIYKSSSNSPKNAALYTPYNIIFGGGESYFLQSAAALQSLGYDVDIIVDPTNAAKTVGDVMKTAVGLRVDLQRKGLRLLRMHHAGDTLIGASSDYSIFYILGNDKAPLLRGIGLVNFYMCQFPFDLDRPTESARAHTLATYDYVLVNSRFTYDHYAKYAANEWFDAMASSDTLVPQMELLPPPIQSFQASQDAHASRRNIVVLGRFFYERQNKGQHVAIAVFQALQRHIPNDTRLLLIGNPMPGHDAYLDYLRRKSAGLNVDIITGQSPARVHELLQTSLVQWHLTGADLVLDDPASHEHFGMSIVEGMLLGCVPVVLKRGGVVDIVVDGVNGFLAADLDDVAAKTAHVFTLPQHDLAQIKAAANATAESFSADAFTRKLKVLVHRGFLTRPFKHAIRQGLPIMRESVPMSVARSTASVAVMIEPRHHYALRFCVINAMTHLPRTEWSLHVFHGTNNGRFVRIALADVKGTKYTRLPHSMVTIPVYNDILKSTSFWNALDGDNVLLFQTDSLLTGTNAADFVGHYDFVGAPWHQENERWSVMRDILGPEGVGNGGMSLRTKSSALDIIKHHGKLSNSSEHEDVFFVKHVVKGDYRMAPRQVAYAFALEVPCSDLKHVDAPFSVHAPWYYNEEKRTKQLLNRALPVI